jgi:hypothetical protein
MHRDFILLAVIAGIAIASVPLYAIGGEETDDKISMSFFGNMRVTAISSKLA